MIALVGNPNSGKSSLFNTITNSNIKVGNYPGITVDIKQSCYKTKKLVDLPGIYSLNSYTEEENITSKFIKNNKIDLIVNVIDINNLNRSLFLTLQLIDLNIPLIIVLNKIDNSKINININKLEKILNTDIIAISTKNNININRLEKYILLSSINNNKTIFKINSQEKDIIDKYKMIDNIYNKVLISKREKINILQKFAFNKYVALLSSIIIFLFMYLIGINIIGAYIASIIDNVLSFIKDYLYNINYKSIIFKDLIILGIFPGISSILTFIPQILILIFMLSLLEDSGYIAYLSINYHNILKKIGLSGKSFLPLMSAFNCSVVGILATRTIKSKKERLKATLLIPFIPCSAKMTLIIFITSTFFKNSFFIFISFYAICIFIILIISLIFTKEKDEFIIEVPSLKLPSLKNSLKNTYTKIKSIIMKISTIILFVSIITFLLTSFDFNLNYNVSFKDSILYFFINKFSSLVIPFTGRKNSKILFSILNGIIAKEQVISSISLFKNSLNQITSYTFSIFNILTIPCINTLTCIKKEYGKKIFIIYSLIYILISYTVSTLIFKVLIFLSCK